MIKIVEQSWLFFLLTNHHRKGKALSRALPPLVVLCTLYWAFCLRYLSCKWKMKVLCSICLSFKYRGSYIRPQLWRHRYKIPNIYIYRGSIMPLPHLQSGAPEQGAPASFTISGLLRVGGQEARAGKFVNGSILQLQSLRCICGAPTCIVLLHWAKK